MFIKYILPQLGGVTEAIESFLKMTDAAIEDFQTRGLANKDTFTVNQSMEIC